MNVELPSGVRARAAALHRAELPATDAGTPYGLLLLDSQQRIVAADCRALAFLRARGTALIGQPLVALFPVPERAQQGARMTQALAQAARLERPEPVPGCRLLQSDGSQVEVDLALARLPQPPTFALMLHQPGAALLPGGPGDWRSMLRRLQSVVELSPLAIWIAEDDCVRFANSAAARLVGAASHHALVGCSVRSLLRPDAHPELRHQLDKVLAHPGTLGSMQAALLRQDGQPGQIEIALTALPDHGHTTVQMVLQDVTQRQRELRELESSRLALRRLSANIVEGREAERQRIARELHDELGQSLSMLKLELCAYNDEAAPGPRKARLEVMTRRLDGIMNDVRRIAADLRPLMLDELGLGPAIEALVHDFARRTGLHCELRLDEVDALEDDHAAIALYRMVQEALTNVQRHAQASTVRVELLRREDHVRLRVSDNGVGLAADAQHRDSQFGLLGMRERADMLGGEIRVGSVPGGGACIEMRMPLKSARARAARGSG